MIADALHADIFKGVACAVAPYIREVILPEKAPVLDCNDLQKIHDCARYACERLANGDTLEEFCRETDDGILVGVCEFCQHQWVELRFREWGLAHEQA